MNFGGKAAYSDPEFVWITPVGLTAIKSLSYEKLGRQYENDLFVSDINNGNLYHFDLDHNRTQFQLNGSLADKIANTRVQSYSSDMFGQGFGGITDLEVGPDGYLYVVSYGTGAIYRIAPK